MPITIKCQCGRLLKIPDKLAGRRVRCPKCDAAVEVPKAKSSSTGEPQPAKTSAEMKSPAVKSPVNKSSEKPRTSSGPSSSKKTTTQREAQKEALKKEALKKEALKKETQQKSRFKGAPVPPAGSSQKEPAADAGKKPPVGEAESKTQPPKTQPPKTQPPKKQSPKKQSPKKQPPKTQPPKNQPPISQAAKATKSSKEKSREASRTAEVNADRKMEKQPPTARTRKDGPHAAVPPPLTKPATSSGPKPPPLPMKRPVEDQKPSAAAEDSERKKAKSARWRVKDESLNPKDAEKNTAEDKATEKDRVEQPSSDSSKKAAPSQSQRTQSQRTQSQVTQSGNAQSEKQPSSDRPPTKKQPPPQPTSRKKSQVEDTEVWEKDAIAAAIENTDPEPPQPQPTTHRQEAELTSKKEGKPESQQEKKKARPKPPPRKPSQQPKQTAATIARDSAASTTPASTTPVKAVPPQPVTPAPAPVEPAPEEIVHGVAATLPQRVTVFYLAASLTVMALFGMSPAVWNLFEYLTNEDGVGVARWALVLLLVGVVQLAYALYVTQLPDWSTVWVLALMVLCMSTGYAVFLGVCMMSTEQNEIMVVLDLGDRVYGNKATGWCFIMMLISSLFTYFAGGISVRWYRSERQLREAIGGQ